MHQGVPPSDALDVNIIINLFGRMSQTPDFKMYQAAVNLYSHFPVSSCSSKSVQSFAEIWSTQRAHGRLLAGTVGNGHAHHASKGDCWRPACWRRPRRTPRAKGDCWQADCWLRPRGLPPAQDTCWPRPRAQFKFNFKRGSRLCRSLPSGRCRLCRSPRGSRFCRRKLSGRCRRCRSPRAVGEPLSAFRLQLACRSTQVVGMPLSACRCRPSGRSWLAAPLGLLSCRCRLAGRNRLAAPANSNFETSST